LSAKNILAAASSSTARFSAKAIADISAHKHTYYSNPHTEILINNIAMKHGFFRIASAVPLVRVADVTFNENAIMTLVRQAAKQSVDLVVFPEMCTTAYTCGDLFHNELLLNAVVLSLTHMADLSRSLKTTFVVGAPLVVNGTLYNTAIFINGGDIVAAIPKTYLPNYNEFYEKRWWANAPDSNAIVKIGDREVPFGVNILVDVNGVKVGAEICEDLWTVIPPSSNAALAGAEVIVNLSASDALIGKRDYIKGLVSQQSARCLCAYAYSSAGYGESSTDLVFDGISFIAENGTIQAENTRWNNDGTMTVADIDIHAIRRDRLHVNSFNDCARRSGVQQYSVYSVNAPLNSRGRDLIRTIDSHPFVPSDPKKLDQRCEEIINIQAAGLARRIEHTHSLSLVVGISGGLDSTLALLVAVHAYKRLGRDVSEIIGVTMPGFGTTDRTYNNALQLMTQLGVTIREISIAAAVTQHFKDINHDKSVHDVTYENCQARERTQILMDVANQTQGMVLGTGDLSELALGWATYNGDHMSMYGVNAGIPKTLVKYLVRWFAINAEDTTLGDTLNDIIDTPISPELIPADKNGQIKQKTEDLVGPYELHDFFIYYTLRYGFSTERIFMLAQHAFAGVYDDTTIQYWLTTFVRRFFNQQFKRSCLPDGPKVGSVCLSPRGDWRMPSDATSSMWFMK
jgi:NAD+ synthase (glutamine-hydrolysing)